MELVVGLKGILIQDLFFGILIFLILYSLSLDMMYGS